MRKRWFPHCILKPRDAAGYLPLPSGEAACPHVPLLPLAPVVAELSLERLGCPGSLAEGVGRRTVANPEGIVRASLHRWSKLGQVSCVPERHKLSLLV